LPSRKHRQNPRQPPPKNIIVTIDVAITQKHITMLRKARNKG
jgi:hypothetical protein